jgi:NADP-dependent 3-hydroxy acid dehydrogenase YdfG
VFVLAHNLFSHTLIFFPPLNITTQKHSNAGIFGTQSEDEQGPIKGNIDDWERVLDVNIRAPMIWTKHFANTLIDNKRGGTIINIGDAEGSHTGPHHPVYAASKHALRGWSLACYEKLRHQGIAVVHLAPGNVSGTHMMSQTEKAAGHQGAISPEDVAEACLFALHLKDAVPVEIELKALRGEATAMATE